MHEPRPRSLHDVSYVGEFIFEAPPEELWETLQRVDLFPMWWQWMRDVRLEGEALASGSVISFGIDPPIPYKLHVAVQVVESARPHRLQGRVSGDLMGEASLEFHPHPRGTRAVTTWDVEIASRAIRPIIRLVRPLLIRAQHWAVEVSLRGFRRYLAERP